MPRQAILIFEPAASVFFTALEKLLLQLIHFLLRLAIQEERYSWRERELRTAVWSHEFLSLELERR